MEKITFLYILTSYKLNVIITVSAFLVAIIAFGNEIAEKTKFQFLNNLYFKIIVTVISFTGGCWATVEKDAIAENEMTAKDSLNKAYLEKKDSLSKSFLEKALINNSNKNIEAYTNALAEYNLEYKKDQNKVFELLKDSIQNDKPSLSLGAGDGKTPGFFLQYDSISDRVKGYLIIKNLGNCELSVNLRYRFGIETPSKEFIAGENTVWVYLNDKISVSGVLSMPFSFYGQMKKVGGILFIWLEGDYSCITSNKNYPIDQLQMWDFENEDNFGRVSLVSKVRSVKKQISKQ